MVVNVMLSPTATSSRSRTARNVNVVPMAAAATATSPSQARVKDHHYYLVPTHSSPAVSADAKPKSKRMAPMTKAEEKKNNKNNSDNTTEDQRDQRESVEVADEDGGVEERTTGRNNTVATTTSPALASNTREGPPYRSKSGISDRFRSRSRSWSQNQQNMRSSLSKNSSSSSSSNKNINNSVNAVAVSATTANSKVAAEVKETTIPQSSPQQAQIQAPSQSPAQAQPPPPQAQQLFLRRGRWSPIHKNSNTTTSLNRSTSAAKKATASETPKGAAESGNETEESTGTEQKKPAIAKRSISMSTSTSNSNSSSSSSTNNKGVVVNTDYTTVYRSRSLSTGRSASRRRSPLLHQHQYLSSTPRHIDNIDTNVAQEVYDRIGVAHTYQRHCNGYNSSLSHPTGVHSSEELMNGEVAVPNSLSSSTSNRNTNNKFNNYRSGISTTRGTQVTSPIQFRDTAQEKGPYTNPISNASTTSTSPFHLRGREALAANIEKRRAKSLSAVRIVQHPSEPRSSSFKQQHQYQYPSTLYHRQRMNVLGLEKDAAAANQVLDSSFSSGGTSTNVVDSSDYHDHDRSTTAFTSPSVKDRTALFGGRSSSSQSASFSKAMIATNHQHYQRHLPILTSSILHSTNRSPNDRQLSQPQPQPQSQEIIRSTRSLLRPTSTSVTSATTTAAATMAKTGGTVLTTPSSVSLPPQTQHHAQSSIHPSRRPIGIKVAPVIEIPAHVVNASSESNGSLLLGGGGVERGWNLGGGNPNNNNNNINSNNNDAQSMISSLGADEASLLMASPPSMALMTKQSASNLTASSSYLPAHLYLPNQHHLDDDDEDDHPTMHQLISPSAIKNSNKWSRNPIFRVPPSEIHSLSNTPKARGAARLLLLPTQGSSPQQHPVATLMTTSTMSTTPAATSFVSSTPSPPAHWNNPSSIPSRGKVLPTTPTRTIKLTSSPTRTTDWMEKIVDERLQAHLAVWDERMEHQLRDATRHIEQQMSVQLQALQDQIQQVNVIQQQTRSSPTSVSPLPFSSSSSPTPPPLLHSGVAPTARRSLSSPVSQPLSFSANGVSGGSGGGVAHGSNETGLRRW